MKEKKYHHGDLRSQLFKILMSSVTSESLNDFSLREAARAIGVSSAAPYNHFPDKKSLIEYSINRSRSIFLNYLKQHSFDKINSKNTLKRLGKSYIEYSYNNPEIFIFIFSQRINLKKKSSYFCDLKSIFLEAVSSNIQEEKLRKNITIESVAYSAWSMIHGLAYFIASGEMSSEEKNTTDVDELFNKIYSIWVVGATRPLTIN